MSTHRTKAIALGLACVLAWMPASALAATTTATISPTAASATDAAIPEIAVPTPKPAPVLVIASYKTSTKRVLVGARFTLTLEIDNATARRAENVVVSLQSGATGGVAEATTVGGGLSVVGSGNAKFLGTIKGSQSDSVSFDVMAGPGTAAGTYTVPVTIAFEYNGERQEVTQTIGIVVERDAQFSMVLSELPDESMIGETFDVSFEVANTSGFALSAVTLSVEATDAVVADDKLFLGSFDAAGSETIDVQVTPKKAGDLEVVLVVSYRDDFGRDRSFRAPYTVKVTAAPKDTGESDTDVEPPASEGNWFSEFFLALFGLGS